MSGHPRYRARVRTQHGFDEMAHGVEGEDGASLLFGKTISRLKARITAVMNHVYYDTSVESLNTKADEDEDELTT